MQVSTYIRKSLYMGFNKVINKNGNFILRTHISKKSKKKFYLHNKIKFMDFYTLKKNKIWHIFMFILKV